MSPTAGLGRPSGIGLRRWWVLALAALVAGGVIAARLLLSDGAARAPSGPMASFVNQAGGYSLHYPTEWTVTAMGSTTKLTNRAKDVVVGIGEAPAGKLTQASERFTGVLLQAYKDVRLESRQAQEIGGRPAVLAAGSAKNISRVELRWLTITIEHRGRNFGISVFTSASTDPREVLPQLHDIVESFRPLR